jgi:hypothetical protein
MLEALYCDVRQQILLDLSDPARGGRANVALLAARTGIDPKSSARTWASSRTWA